MANSCVVGHSLPRAPAEPLASHAGRPVLTDWKLLGFGRHSGLSAEPISEPVFVNATPRRGALHPVIAPFAGPAGSLEAPREWRPEKSDSSEPPLSVASLATAAFPTGPGTRLTVAHDAIHLEEWSLIAWQCALVISAASP